LITTDVATVSVITHHLLPLVRDIGAHGFQPFECAKGILPFSVFGPVKELIASPKLLEPMPKILPLNSKKGRTVMTLPLTSVNSLLDYFLNFLLIATRPTNPDPRSHTGGGMGTGFVAARGPILAVR